MCVLCQASTALHDYSIFTILSRANRNISSEISPASKSRWLICNSISLMHSLDNSYPDVIILRAPLIFLQMLGCKSKRNCKSGSFSAVLIISLLLVVRSNPIKKEKSPDRHNFAHRGYSCIFIYAPEQRTAGTENRPVKLDFGVR